MMPPNVTTLRVLLVVRLALGAVLLFADSLESLGADPDEVLARTGFTPLELLPAVAFLLAVLLLDGYVVVTLGRGGRRPLVLVRVLFGLSLLQLFPEAMLGGFRPILLVLALVALVMAETRPAKAWFRATGPNAVAPPAVPGGYGPGPQPGAGGYGPGPGGYPGGYPGGHGYQEFQGHSNHSGLPGDPGHPGHSGQAGPAWPSDGSGPDARPDGGRPAADGH
ncbi:hypothetical protein DFP74_2943 [Nocardiopsis sp. Huas11]|uniref:hypothetical protein n=1 Tax=Nocardiopsis sp. Huas11 TaxID=2183912 RepID=UPI000F0D3B33|nr:hypothetical protein [Nocardiopsis sp. Huas11]RKS07279.1 hypothetical protein DFP74_2943 [Nocardiopsis sp. Huas11]